MNGQSIAAFCFIRFSVIAGLIFAAPLLPQQPASSGSAFVSVQSKISGLPVLVNNREAGFTPLRFYALPPGTHEIAVKRSRPESWLDYDWVQTVTLHAGDTLELVANFLVGYSLNSTPFGAEVYLDGMRQGTTPLVLRLPEGETATVEIHKTGYRPAQLQIGGKVEEDTLATPTGLPRQGASRLYTVTLEKEENYASLYEIEQSRKLLRVSRNRRLALTAAGLSLASGVAAIVLKQKADHFYERYLTASTPTERETAYERTVEYDRYSGIATAVFEVSFAASLYFFLKSTAK
ncbi:MAG: PEGA domain-containing protein [candidate division KSB1 bacterium]|nr:PEGA domain-containing protein [candidate division KSB1 bacterium]